MKGREQRFATYNLLETYHELGSYQFKVVLDPKYFKNSHLCSAEMIDSDGKRLNFNVEKWGRKMNFSFEIDEKIPDGVVLIKLSLCPKDGDPVIEERMKIWVIK